AARKSGRGLALCLGQQRRELRFRAHDTHAPASASGRSFQHHWVTDLVRQGQGYFGTVQYTTRAKKSRNAGVLHDCAGKLLRPHLSDNFRPCADEFDPGELAYLSEISVLTQKAVSRMHGVHVCDFRSTDDGWNI